MQVEASSFSWIFWGRSHLSPELLSELNERMKWRGKKAGRCLYIFKYSFLLFTEVHYRPGAAVKCQRSHLLSFLSSSAESTYKFHEILFIPCRGFSGWRKDADWSRTGKELPADGIWTSGRVTSLLSPLARCYCSLLTQDSSTFPWTSFGNLP